MIVSAIHRYQQELSQIINRHLTKIQRKTRDALLEITDENDHEDAVAEEVSDHFFSA